MWALIRRSMESTKSRIKRATTTRIPTTSTLPDDNCIMRFTPSARVMTVEERKREKLLGEAHDAVEHARDEREVREWVKIVSGRAATASREEKFAVLRALGARVTIWRADHVHDDGWPQRYKIALHWTGFTGSPVTLPASHGGNLSQTTFISLSRSQSLA
jgi:hypothetical protein